jgi:hypothetical protein
MLAHTQKNPELGNNDKDTYTKKTYAQNYKYYHPKWAMEKNNTMKEEECGKGCSACGRKSNGNKVIR